jgi:hypothetical protein
VDVDVDVDMDMDMYTYFNIYYKHFVKQQWFYALRRL